MTHFVCPFHQTIPSLLADKHSAQEHFGWHAFDQQTLVKHAFGHQTSGIQIFGEKTLGKKTDNRLTGIGPTDIWLLDIWPSDIGPSGIGPTDTGPTDTGPTDIGSNHNLSVDAGNTKGGSITVPLTSCSTVLD